MRLSSVRSMPFRPFRLGIIFGTFGPYHLARVRETYKLGKEKGVEVFGIEFATEQYTYPWKNQKADFPKITLFKNYIQEDVSSFRYIIKMWRVMSRMSPDAIAICGYDNPVALAALFWAKLSKKIVILMSESKQDDLPRKLWKESLKRLIFYFFDGALVGGEPQKDYAVALGIPKDKVLVGYDIVDNNFYRSGARVARATEDRVRFKLGLPNRYFLTVARFIEKKNLFRLIEAYRLYRKMCQGYSWEMVICGGGYLENELRDTAANLAGVHFPGIKQADELLEYYGIASTFIIPSSHYEQWGLVVNEAMAAGLPVLVSRACGCARDLVREGVNGFTFNPYDLEEMASLMLKMSSGQVDIEKMGESSLNIIKDWGPELFAKNLFKVIETAKLPKKS